MSTNGTPNYGLKQWVNTDKPNMEEFNETNRIIDSELKTLNENRMN